MADALSATLAAVARQTYASHETIVIVDADCGQDEVRALRARYPWVRVEEAPSTNYCAGKNHGARAAAGEVVALLDGDCEPVPDWLESLVARIDDHVSVVAGRTLYRGGEIAARTFSFADFGAVKGDSQGQAGGLLLNNVAFRRAVLLQHPLEEQIRRNGGCYLLYHELRAAGIQVAYEPRALISHILDVGGLGFVRKHFDRGYDAVAVYALDRHAVLRGTPLMRRFPLVGLLPITVRRILLDWARLLRIRGHFGIRTAWLPYYAVVMLAIRGIEFAGGVSATIGRNRRV